MPKEEITLISVLEILKNPEINRVDLSNDQLKITAYKLSYQNPIRVRIDIEPITTKEKSSHA